jgi:predicted component of type VI protein secretion system
MKIVGTQVSNRRRDRRVSTVPIAIELEGKVYTSLDWSLGGFLIEGYDGKRRPGQEVTVGIQVVAGETELNHVARAEIVRVDLGTNQLAANFTALDNATLNTLEGWLTGRLRRQALRQKAG